MEKSEKESKYKNNIKTICKLLLEMSDLVKSPHSNLSNQLEAILAKLKPNQSFSDVADQLSNNIHELRLLLLEKHYIKEDEAFREGVDELFNSLPPILKEINYRYSDEYLKYYIKGLLGVIQRLMDKECFDNITMYICDVDIKPLEPLKIGIQESKISTKKTKSTQESKLTHYKIETQSNVIIENETVENTLERYPTKQEKVTKYVTKPGPTWEQFKSNQKVNDDRIQKLDRDVKFLKEQVIKPLQDQVKLIKPLEDKVQSIIHYLGFGS
jgi:hypothetical protein